MRQQSGTTIKRGCDRKGLEFHRTADPGELPTNVVACEGDSVAPDRPRSTVICQVFDSERDFVLFRRLRQIATRHTPARGPPPLIPVAASGVGLVHLVIEVYTPPSSQSAYLSTSGRDQ